MRMGEVCLYTRDVVGLADFYRMLLGLKAGQDKDDPVHQLLRAEETALAVYNDGTERKENHQNICLAFTVEDVDREYERLRGLGITVLAPPATRPWGARNMMLTDPEGNQIFLRSFANAGETPAADTAKEEG